MKRLVLVAAAASLLASAVWAAGPVGGAGVGAVGSEGERNAAGRPSPAGLKLTDVAKGSVYEKLGLKKGDLVVALNGKPLKDPLDLRKSIQAGGLLRIEIVRDGRHQTISNQISPASK